MRVVFFYGSHFIEAVEMDCVPRAGDTVDFFTGKGDIGRNLVVSNVHWRLLRPDGKTTRTAAQVFLKEKEADVV